MSSSAPNSNNNEGGYTPVNVSLELEKKIENFSDFFFVL